MLNFWQARIKCLLILIPCLSCSVFLTKVERLWDMMNVACSDSQAAVISGVTSLAKRRKFNKQDMKLSVILQFVAHGGELKKLQRIGKEFAEFVVYSKRKRYANLHISHMIDHVICP